MPASINQWRAVIGLFGVHRYVAINNKRILKHLNLNAPTVLLFFYKTINFLFLVQYGDIKINSAPRKKQPKYFSCFYWNVNSLLPRNKISMLTAYNTIHKHDVICLLEISFCSSVLLDVLNLPIQGYSLIWGDQPDNVKRGGVCLYFKEHWTKKIIENSFIAQCTACEITFQNQRRHAVVMDPSQSQSIWVWRIFV